eukprot:3980741-Pyramimonas_sp.AAC.2
MAEALGVPLPFRRGAAGRCSCDFAVVLKASQGHELAGWQWHGSVFLEAGPGEALGRELLGVAAFAWHAR